MGEKLRVAARGSRLSVIQTEEAVSQILPLLGLTEWELVRVKTLGDTRWDRPIHELGSQGAFTREVDRVVLRGEADVAVHSLKDMPSSLHPELEIVYVAPRPSPRDAFIPGPGVSARMPHDLPEGSSVGTSSLRRQALLAHHAPQAQAVPLRGNLDTRLRRLREGCCDAIIVAEAGLKRLGVNVEYTPLPVSWWPTSPGQGFVAVVAPRDSWIARRLRGATRRDVEAEYRAERALLSELGAGCRTPVAGTAQLRDGVLTMTAALWDGDTMRMASARGEPGKPEELARRVARMLR